MKENGQVHDAALSGVYFSLGIAPHLLFLLTLFLGSQKASLTFLIPPYFATILVGEYLFLQRIAPTVQFTDWLKRAFHPRNPGYLLWTCVSEILFDIIFLVLALKLNWTPLNFFILLLGLKSLSAPIQVYLSYFYLPKNIAFTFAVSTPVLLLFMAGQNPEMFLYAVILKAVFCNGIAVARSQYVQEIDALKKS